MEKIRKNMTDKDYLDKAFTFAFELCGSKQNYNILARQITNSFNEFIDSKNYEKFSCSYKSFAELYKKLQNNTYQTKGLKSKTENILAAFILLRKGDIKKISLYKKEDTTKWQVEPIYWDKFKDWYDTQIFPSPLPIDYNIKNLTGIYYGMQISSTTKEKNLLFLHIQENNTVMLRHRNMFHIGQVYIRQNLLYILLDTANNDDKNIFICNIYKYHNSDEHIKSLIFHQSFTRGTELITRKNIFLYEANQENIKKFGLNDLNSIPSSSFLCKEIAEKFDPNIFSNLVTDFIITPKTAFIHDNDKILSELKLYKAIPEKTNLNNLPLKNLAGVYYGVYYSTDEQDYNSLVLEIQISGKSNLQGLYTYKGECKPFKDRLLLEFYAESDNTDVNVSFFADTNSFLGVYKHIWSMIMDYVYTKNGGTTTGRAIFFYQDTITNIEHTHRDNVNISELLSKIPNINIDFFQGQKTPKNCFLYEKNFLEEINKILSASKLRRVPSKLLKNLVGNYKIFFDYKKQGVRDYIHLTMEEKNSDLIVSYKSENEQMNGYAFFSDQVLFIEVSNEEDKYIHLFRFKVSEHLHTNFEILIGMVNGSTYDHKEEAQFIICMLKLHNDKVKDQINIHKVIQSNFWNLPTGNIIYRNPDDFKVDNLDLSIIGSNKVEPTISYPYPSIDLNNWEIIFINNFKDEKPIFHTHSLSQEGTQITINPSLFHKDQGKGENKATIDGSYEENFFVIDICKSSVRLSIYAEKTNFDRKIPMIALISGKKVEHNSMTAFNAILYHKEVLEENKQYIEDFLTKHSTEIIVKETFWQYKTEQQARLP